MIDWEKYVAEEEKKAHDARVKAQEMITQFGVPLDELAEIAKIDLNTIDPEIRQQIELSLGVSIDSVPKTKPKANASTYRQRGKGIAV
jgi:hypothetical protein